MLFSFIIPTYNRSQFLLKNLLILQNHINKINNHWKFEIVISNNCSTDNTDNLVRNFQIENPLLNINYYQQKENLGIEKNCLFVLQEAKGEYIMYLGDDDYIDFGYVYNALKHINKNPNTHLILPSIVEVDINDILVKEGRDYELPNTHLKAGFKNCLRNSWRGHQLSGLVFKRKNLYHSYIKNEVQNLYPFIYFTGLACLRGDTYHLTEYPVRVTNPGQQNKNWTYGEDGLINEIFDNYIKLPVNYFQKTRLQIELIRRQPWRLWRYKKITKKAYYSVFWNMLSSSNSTLLFKIIFPFEIAIISLKKNLYKLLKS